MRYSIGMSKPMQGPGHQRSKVDKSDELNKPIRSSGRGTQDRIETPNQGNKSASCLSGLSRLLASEEASKGEILCSDLWLEGSQEKGYELGGSSDHGIRALYTR